MNSLFKSIEIVHGETTKKIYINVNLAECIAPNEHSVTIKMNCGSEYLVRESIFTLLERLQS